MKVTVIGAGNMASGLVKQLSLAGHEVLVTARSADKAAALAAQYPHVSAVAAAGAAKDADVVIAATFYGDAIAALHSLGDLSGKVVVDISNPVTADFMSLAIGHTTSAAEEIARALPGATVVKAFNTVFAQVLAGGADFGNGQTVPVFVAGDSTEAKARVRTLAESLGFESIDAGGLVNARYLEPLGALNIYLGYGAGLGTAIAPTWLHKAN